MNQQIRTNLYLNTNQADGMRLHTITSGSYPYTALEGLIVYFTNGGASLDFTDGEGLYVYDGISWIRMAREDELLPINSPIIIRGTSTPNGGAMDFPYANPAGAVGMTQTGGGSGGGGSIVAGNAWIITGGSYPATLPGGANVSVGDMMIALVNAASPTNSAHWSVVEGNNNPASETNSGVIKIATQVLTDAGIDDTTAVSPLKLKTNLQNTGFIIRHSVTINGISGTAIFSGISAVSQIENIVVLDDDYLPVTIGLGTPFISLGQLNLPWTSSFSLTNFRIKIFTLV